MKKNATIFIFIILAFLLSTNATFAQPTISIDRTSIDFGNVPVGSEVHAGVYITNTGNIPLVISSQPTVTGEGFIYYQGHTTIQPNETGWVGVCFRPTVAGPHTGTLTIEHNGVGSPTIINLTGNGTFEKTTISINRNTIDFGNVEVGSSIEGFYTRQYVEIINTGNVWLVISPDPTVIGEGFTLNGYSDRMVILCKSAYAVIHVYIKWLL